MTPEEKSEILKRCSDDPHLLRIVEAGLGVLEFHQMVAVRAVQNAKKAKAKVEQLEREIACLREQLQDLQAQVSPEKETRCIGCGGLEQGLYRSRSTVLGQDIIRCRSCQYQWDIPSDQDA